MLFEHTQPPSLEKWTFSSAVCIKSLESWLAGGNEDHYPAVYLSMEEFLYTVLGDIGRLQDKQYPGAFSDWTSYGISMAVWSFFDLGELTGLNERADLVQRFARTLEALRVKRPRTEIKQEDVESALAFMRRVSEQSENDASTRFSREGHEDLDRL